MTEVTDYPANILAEPTREELSLQINTLQREVERLNNVNKSYYSTISELRIQIDNVKEYITEQIEAGNELSEDLTTVSEILEIELTKEISGTAVYEISWSAVVPLGFDADDIEITFDVECQSDVEEFDWNEDNCDVSSNAY